MSFKLNLTELESLRSELIEKTLNTSSNNLRLFLYHNYFERILPLNNSNLEEAFLKEFLDDYLNSIKKYEVWGNDPGVTKKIFEQLNNMCEHTLASEHIAALGIEIKRIESQWIKLTKILNGDDLEDEEIHKAFFPLIDNEAPGDFDGTVESVTVRISKTMDVDKFIIVPSEKEIEKRILDQCRNSWLLALNISKKYVKKPYEHHEVILSFDKKEGFYEGNSLGIALTLSFLEEILKFYNPTYLIKLIEKSAFTGGVAESGEILNTSESIIKRKVSAIFFSQINSFVIPKLEETYAYFILAQLKKNYPNRKLKLIPAEDITDVLNRRDLVDIRKQKTVIRTAKFVKKNWISAVATVLLAILFGYLFVMDFDDNPAILTSDGSTLYIKNRNGKLLWTKTVSVDKFEIQNKRYKTAKIVKIYNTGRNGLILCKEGDKNNSEINSTGLTICYDYKGNELWRYNFKDIAEADREVMNATYGANILDTLTYLGSKSIFLFSNNGPSFSSAIYSLNLKTGERLSGTFWASGSIMDGIIKDIDNDDEPDIVGVGYENGYEDFVFFTYEIDTLTKVRPTTEEYLIRDYPIAEMKCYIRFPKTDFDNYFEQRTPGYVINSFADDENNKKFVFATSFPKTVDDHAIGYEINYDLKNINVVIDSDFRVKRDTLVNHDKLDLPYTDTEEYKNMIKNKILYWKNGNWVKRNELDRV